MYCLRRECELLIFKRAFAEKVIKENASVAFQIAISGDESAYYDGLACVFRLARFDRDLDELSLMLERVHPRNIFRHCGGRSLLLRGGALRSRRANDD